MYKFKDFKQVHGSCPPRRVLFLQKPGQLLCLYLRTAVTFSRDKGRLHKFGELPMDKIPPTLDAVDSHGPSIAEAV